MDLIPILVLCGVLTIPVLQTPHQRVYVLEPETIPIIQKELDAGWHIKEINNNLIVIER